MKKNITSLPGVGFDRFIELDWVNFALDLALRGGDVPELKTWLADRIEGKDACRKTANLLTNLWLREYPETSHLRSEALKLASEVDQDQFVVLHWGMALANFALFSQTVDVIGRLLRIQGDIERVTVRKRVLEAYSNQGTIPRSVDRIIQSLIDWRILESDDKKSFHIQNSIFIEDGKIFNWLVKCMVNSDPKTGIAVIDISRAQKLFPFEIGADVRKVLRQSGDFEVVRSGRNEEMVVLKQSA